MNQAIAMNAVAFGSENRPKRFEDDNGFLHVFIRVMRTGTLDYSPATYQDGAPPDAVGPNGKITVLVTPEELSDPESLASLKGMPGIRRHEALTPDMEKDVIGTVAGEPEYVEENGVGYVECEAVIIDADTIARLNSGELVEVSACYRHDVNWEPGEYEGQPYAGEQRNIRYNHFVLLREGEGRAGPDVMVVNSKENDVEKIMVWSRKLKKAVFAMNEDDAKAIAELDDAAAGEESSDGNEGANNPGLEENGGDNGGGDTPPSEVAQIKNLDKLLDELAKSQAKTAELEGQLQVAREKINELLSPGTLEAEAESLATEREEAVEVMAENGIEKTVAMNSIKEGKLRGHDLRVFAMNSIREKQGKSKIEGDALKDESLVRGMWNATKDYAGAKKVVVGALAQNSTAMNGADDYIKQSRRNLGFDVK